MKGSMGKDGEVFAVLIRQRYWQLLPWAGKKQEQHLNER